MLALNLVQYGGHVNITRHLAYSSYEVCSEKNYYISEQIHTNRLCSEVKHQFLDAVVENVEMGEVCLEKTDNRIVPSSTCTMAHEGASCIEMVGTKDKRQITAVLCGTIQEDFLPVQLIYKDWMLLSKIQICSRVAHHTCTKTLVK